MVEEEDDVCSFPCTGVLKRGRFRKLNGKGKVKTKEARQTRTPRGRGRRALFYLFKGEMLISLFSSIVKGWLRKGKEKESKVKEA